MPLTVPPPVVMVSMDNVAPPAVPAGGHGPIPWSTFYDAADNEIGALPANLGLGYDDSVGAEGLFATVAGAWAFTFTGYGAGSTANRDSVYFATPTNPLNPQIDIPIGAPSGAGYSLSWTLTMEAGETLTVQVGGTEADAPLSYAAMTVVRLI